MAALDVVPATCLARDAMAVDVAAVAAAVAAIGRCRVGMAVAVTAKFTFARIG